MKIEIEKEGKYYRADCIDIPGSVLVGIGKTKREAVADLFLTIQRSNLWGYIDTRMLIIDKNVTF